MGKILVCLFVYGLLVGLYILENFVGKEVPTKRSETLNSFECPVIPRNQYDCQRFDLEKSGEYPFFYQNDMLTLDATFNLKLYRQTGLNYNHNATLHISLTFSELFLDSDGQETDRATRVIDLTFYCIPNERICGSPVTLMSEEYLSSGKRYFLLSFPDHENLIKEIKQAEVYVQTFDHDYQKYFIYFKLSMLMLTSVCTYLYYESVKYIGRNSWPAPQRWILFLSGAILCLNDPFSLIYYRFGIKFLILISNLVVELGFSIILTFWIAILRNIRLQEHGRFITWDEIALTAINAIFTIICGFAVPDHNSFLSSTWRNINYVGCCMIAYQTFRNLLNLKKLSLEDKLLLISTLYIGTIYFGFIRRWGNPIDMNNRNFGKVLAMICVFSIYLLVCQYLYAFKKVKKLDKNVADDSFAQRKAYNPFTDEIDKTDFNQE